MDRLILGFKIFCIFPVFSEICGNYAENAEICEKCGKYAENTEKCVNMRKYVVYADDVEICGM